MWFIDEVRHSGTPQQIDFDPHGSGRYRQGSGENPYQHDNSFLNNVRQLQAKGFTEVEIAQAMGMSTTDLRRRKTLEKEKLKNWEYQEAVKLKAKGYSNVAIGEKIGRTDTYVHNLLKPNAEMNMRKVEKTADLLKDSVDQQLYIDIGVGTESMLGCSRGRLMTAVQQLENEGYNRYYLKVPQAGIPGQYTSLMTLCAPDVSYNDLYNNREKIGFPLNPDTNVAKLREDRGNDDITVLGIRRPVSIDSNRIKINYAEDGGKDKDGVIEIRRGVEDLSLGNSQYAQVRIAVDDTHYLKGMAMYSDNIPDGYDILFNTNKTKDIPAKDVFKKMKTNPDGSINWDNPFGATLEMEDGRMIGQRDYIDINGETKQSAINIVRSEGSWDTWSKTLASQFLSKQPKALIKQQLNKSYKDKEDEFIDIMQLTNPEVKKYMLEQFADDCDASAAHLKAAALPRQSSKVILPLIDISENEVFAPTYENGEQVVLIRYPHGGTFEIPTLTVNNNIPSGKKNIGLDAPDAIGINTKVAERLSGADFDGDTVVVIPLSSAGQKIKTHSPLRGLKDFDPKEQYGPKTYEEGTIKLMTKSQTQNEMGRISNLITDMTLKGATEDELARAVRHSMVVIDAEKHKLNYQQSEIDNRIKELKKEYQGGENKGASTLISRANADTQINVRVEKYKTVRSDEEQKIFESLSKREFSSLSKAEQKQFNSLNKKMTREEAKEYASGKKIYVDTGDTYNNVRTTKEQNFFDSVEDPSKLSPQDKKKYNDISKKFSREEYRDYQNGIDIYGTLASGKQVKKKYQETVRQQTTPRMNLVEDAYELSSGTEAENLYADYANKLKNLATESRKELRSIPSLKYSPSAKETYSEEVKSLNSKLEVAKSNKPLERRAQVIADITIKSQLADNPSLALDDDELKKLRTQALAGARTRVGASKSDTAVKITEKEWEAIQAGAISSTKLIDILANTNMDRVKELATPRDSKELSATQQNRIRSLSEQGYSLAEIASSIGVSTSTISKYLE